jgi:hypothetical protein
MRALTDRQRRTLVSTLRALVRTAGGPQNQKKENHP